MPESVLELDIYEPESLRLAELLAAIAAKVGLPKLDPGPGARHLVVTVAMDAGRAYELAQQALHEQGDDAHAVVRPVSPERGSL